jgi:hypothetical protein
VILGALFGSYSLFLWKLRGKEKVRNTFMTWRQFGFYLLIVSPLLFAFNALSSDVFNYMFNAKMVLVYHVNPNFVAAQEFSSDLWLRFMSNSHSLAPYGYGWTAISLLPYLLGLSKFTPTWIVFRLFSILSIGLLFLSMQVLSRRYRGRPLRLFEFAIVFLNPLFLIEIIGDAHNDLWMMWPALLAVGLLIPRKALAFQWPNFLMRIGGAVLLFAFSSSIKYATLVLLPVMAGLLFSQLLELYKTQFKQLFLIRAKQLFDEHWPTLAAASLFLPLLTERSRQFHPWYLTWVLVWLPFMKWRAAKVGVLILSVSAMLRYTPWLWTNTFEGNIEFYQKLITFVPLSIATVLYFILMMLKKAKRRE